MIVASKFAGGLLAVACIGMLSAQEVKLRPEKPDDFIPANRVIQTEDGLSAKGLGALFSVKSVTIDPAKKYQISGDFRMKSGKPVSLYFGFAPYDAQNRAIPPSLVFISAASQAEVAEDAKKGDKVIKVKDASKWDVKRGYCHIAFGVKADLSDPTVPPPGQFAVANSIPESCRIMRIREVGHSPATEADLAMEKELDEIRSRVFVSRQR